MILNPVPKCADSSRKQTKPHEALDGRLGCDHIPIFRPNFLQGLRTKVCVSKQSLDQIIDIKKMLGCCGGWWLFVGVGWKAPFLPLDQLPIGCGVRCLCSPGVPQDGCKFNAWRFESSLVHVYFGAQVFSGEVLWSLKTSGKRIGAVIFYHHHHHHCQSHQYFKKTYKA